MKPVDTKRLIQLRDQIDDIDHAIQKLISERAECAQEVAHVKLQDEESANAVFYRPEREAQVLNRVMERNVGPLSNEDMARLFRQVMSACLALEQPLTVAYLGPEGTFTQQAAIKHFGDWVNTKPMNAIDEVFREVEAGAVHYGVVPVENSTEGVVNHTLDSFLGTGSTVKIAGEVELRIHQNILVGENTRTENITRVYSHQQSLAQCRKWLDTYMPHAERIAVSSNADAAKRVKSEWNSAAIAGTLAAEQYGLNVLNQKIEDNPDNSTRFLIIGPNAVQPSGDDKTSLIVAMHNEPGALYKLLKPFYDFDIDMTRLETRPAPSGNWTYVFFIDFIGHEEDENVQKALTEIKKVSLEVRELGSYPKAVL